MSRIGVPATGPFSLHELERLIGERAHSIADASYTRSLLDAGIAWDPGTSGLEALAALRATYEPLLDGLASYLMLNLPGWLPSDGGGDNWQQGPRGLLAGRLIDELSGRGAVAGPDAEPARASAREGRRSLRRRFRIGSAR